MSAAAADLLADTGIGGQAGHGCVLRRGAWRYRRTRRAAASRGGCPSTADDKGKGEYPLLSTLNI